MGQGADSIGYAYEHDYNPYEDGLISGYWQQQNGTMIHVSAMTKTHLSNLIRHLESVRVRATFSDEQELWESWISLLKNELQRRKPQKTAKTAIPVRGTTTAMICHCGAEYAARNADLQRGWALSCSKHCASVRRTYNKPAAQPKS